MTQLPDDLQSELDALRRQLADVTARLTDLQHRGAEAAPPVSPDASHVTAPSAASPASEGAAAAAPAGHPAEEEVPEDVVLAIAAAVAAYLGQRARVRQIRLISSPAWAQQGRVSIQASHRLDRKP